MPAFFAGVVSPTNKGLKMFNVIGTKNGVSEFVLVGTPKGYVPEVFRTIEQAEAEIVFWKSRDPESEFVVVPAV